jgi:CubicO group peptidase (beta-lactamase class C family)
LNTLKKVLGASIPAAIVLVLMMVILLWAEPPDVIRIAANYAAKTVCSNMFIAGRNPLEVLAADVQAPGHPLLKFMRVKVDRQRGVVRAGLLGFIGGGLAVARPGVGCAVVHDGRLETEQAVGSVPVAPEGPTDDDVVSIVPELQRVVEDDALAGPGIRAIVVMHEGRLVAERYAGGFDKNTPQLGWSMTKSVMAGIIGALVKEGRMRLDQAAGWAPGDGRERITIADLLSMSSGLQFNEGYGAVSDVTRMLYLEPDMAAFARAKPLVHPVGQVWSYSSGTAVILSRLVQDTIGADATAFVHSRLFDPLGMKSAVMETDEKGTLVGSSYMYATPRDWARYGQLLAQDGLWHGMEILPRGYAAMMASPVAASGGEYGHGLVWRWATHGEKPAENPDAAFGLPGDSFWMAGHDGQYVAIIPSRHLVIVRMGLTPVRDRYQPQSLVRALLDAARAGRFTPVSGVPAESPQ